jgi:hypothetical protein
MIKRITTPQEFQRLLDDIFLLFDYENSNEGHMLSHNKEYIFNAFGNTHILNWDFFVWANENEESKKFDAVIAFLNNKNEKFGEEIFCEYIWLSKNPLVGRKLLGVAMNFAKEKDFKYVMMNCVTAHPKSKKVARFYEKLGFVKDCETYMAEI